MRFPPGLSPLVFAAMAELAANTATAAAVSVSAFMVFSNWVGNWQAVKRDDASLPG